MYIMMVAPEMAPVAKVGGLGDVVLGLSRELEIRGHAVEVVLPLYDCMRYDHIWGLQVTHPDLWVPWGAGAVRCTVWFGFVHGRKCFFIEPHSPENFFNRGGYYGFPDEHIRWSFFSKAALEFLLQSGKRPDVIHTHDWQTGLVAPLLFEIYKHQGLERQRVCHTIHNFKHQGICGPNVLDLTGLKRHDYYYSRDRLGDDYDPTAINLAKGAVVYANFVTTVSPRHAWEARFTEQGHGLGPVLTTHQAKFGGVLNGLDYEMWNPQTDPHIPHHYDAAAVDGKFADKEALRERLWLRKDYSPIVAYVGRLDPQKGLDLVRHGLYYALERGAQFVLLGSSPEQGINAHFWDIKRQMNDNPDCHLEIGYDEELAHLIYAGADILMVPSLFEPCGLTQMIALRYGTVPVVREVGGLADTVFDKDHSDRPREGRNGFTFRDPDHAGLESALSRAIGLWYDYPDQFRELMENGMHFDYSWNWPGQNYVNIYDYIRHK
ncbi:glycogen synthase GlgA [Endothiovibrio diazotrophicus]